MEMEKCFASVAGIKDVVEFLANAYSMSVPSKVYDIRK